MKWCGFFQCSGVWNPWSVTRALGEPPVQCLLLLAQLRRCSGRCWVLLWGLSFVLEYLSTSVSTSSGTEHTEMCFLHHFDVSCNLFLDGLLLLSSGKWPRGGTGAFVTSFCVAIVRNYLLTGFPLTLGFTLEETCGFRARSQPVALASVELNIEPHPIANLVGELNPWLQAERNQGTQLKWISQGLPGIWLHSQLSSAVCGSRRSPGKPSASSSCESFSMEAQHQPPPDHCHPLCVLIGMMGRSHWNLSIQIWLSQP